MQKMLVLILVLTLSLFASDSTKTLDANSNTTILLKGKTLLALNCIKPIKPILPIKPIWCTGKWTLILRCNQYCNCVWEPVCLQ